MRIHLTRNGAVRPGLVLGTDPVGRPTDAAQLSAAQAGSERSNARMAWRAAQAGHPVRALISTSNAHARRGIGDVLFANECRANASSYRPVALRMALRIAVTDGAPSTFASTRYVRHMRP